MLLSRGADSFFERTEPHNYSRLCECAKRAHFLEIALRGNCCSKGLAAGRLRELHVSLRVLRPEFHFERNACSLATNTVPIRCDEFRESAVTSFFHPTRIVGFPSCVDAAIPSRRNKRSGFPIAPRFPASATCLRRKRRKLVNMTNSSFRKPSRAISRILPRSWRILAKARSSRFTTRRRLASRRWSARNDCFISLEWRIEKRFDRMHLDDLALGYLDTGDTIRVTRRHTKSEHRHSHGTRPRNKPRATIRVLSFT